MAVSPASSWALWPIVAVGVGFFVEWKSGWCSGMCPVHPVEKLYGHPAQKVQNAQCAPCKHCVAICPDSTPTIFSLTIAVTPARRITRALLIGGFPGFVWGWFHVPDYELAEGIHHIGMAYALPFAGLLITLIPYLIARKIWSKREHHWNMARLSGFLAISCYYWYRLPALTGLRPIPDDAFFGHRTHPGDGMLIDLSGHLPPEAALAMQLLPMAFFAWWLLIRKENLLSWSQRPVAQRHGDAPTTDLTVSAKQ